MITYLVNSNGLFDTMLLGHFLASLANLGSSGGQNGIMLHEGGNNFGRLGNGQAKGADRHSGLSHSYPGSGVELGVGLGLSLALLQEHGSANGSSYWSAVL